MSKTPAGKTWINVKSAFGLTLNATEAAALNAKRGKDDAEVLTSQTYAPGRHLVFNEIADDPYVKANCEDHDNAGREVDDLAGASLLEIGKRAEAVGLVAQPGWTMQQYAQAIIDAETAERTAARAEEGADKPLTAKQKKAAEEAAAKTAEDEAARKAAEDTQT